MSQEYICVEGGHRLSGQLELSGAKNAITKLLVASLLSDKSATFYNVPNINDVEITVKLCEEIGSTVHWDRQAKILKIQTTHLKTGFIPQRFSGANRIPILMLGALLGKTGEDIIVPTVGGCHLGKRPVDFHIRALEALGAQVEYREMKREGAYFARAHQGLKGSIIKLQYPSVGATENAILAAVRAKGSTVIEGAAVEPEIIDLILFLQKMGARIQLSDERTIVAHESHEFKEVHHEVIADRNVAVSYACAAIATKGDIFIKNARHEHLMTFCNFLTEIGAGWQIQDGGMRFYYQNSLRGNIHIETDVHPGFMTDWQQPVGVLLTQAQGASVIHETVYENRFGYLNTLNAMGAKTQTFSECLGSGPCRFKNQGNSHSTVIFGPTPLQCDDIVIPDLRAGFAYVIAGLIAKGKSKIYNPHFLTRGYESIVENLQALGAKISWLKEEALLNEEAMKEEAMKEDCLSEV